jgi:hypothetical protein
MMMCIVAAIGFGTNCLLLAAGEPRQKAQVSKTERIDFPSGGTLRLTNSVGALTVEGWDRPDVEITTIKSTKFAYDSRDRDKAAHDLEKVRVAVERRGNELVVTTYFLRRRAFLPNPPGGETNFDLEYRIKAPSTARLIADHDVGEVNIDSLVGDIDVTLLQGEIMLHLPEEGRYDIHAKSDFGAVNSDFPGQQKHRRWLIGHRIVNEDSSQAAHKLNLRVGFGDVVILKTRVPKAPDPLTPALRRDGL